MGPILHPIKDSILLVGDSAGQVKPLSGGGLYTGGLCARIAGRVAAEATRAERTDEERLAEYATRCDRAIGKELRFGSAARGLLDSLSDERLCEALDALDHPELLSFLARVGDIDRLRGIPRLLLRERRLWKRILPFLSLLDAFLGSRNPDSPVAPVLADYL